MPDLSDGESVEMKGSGAKPYVLKNTGGVYSCSCPAWRNQSTAIERRTCKHLRKLRGETAEQARVGLDPGPKLETASEPDGEGAATKTGPPLLLAEKWDNAEDLAGWWVSEKLDGVRAYWNGKALISRLGNLFHAPAWFLEGLPETPLDGELWIGRKAFQRTVGIVRRQDKSDHWKEVRYVVFDAPGVDATFEDRLAFVSEQMARSRSAYLKAHEHTACTGLAQLREELARVETLGGEGLMLRQPGSRYEVGRSTTLLKVKSFRDAEARVLEHLKGAGRHKGRLGALLVELADGTRFRSARASPTPNAQRRRQSAPRSRSATKSFPTAGSRGSRLMSGSGATRACRPPTPNRQQSPVLDPDIQVALGGESRPLENADARSQPPASPGHCHAANRPFP
ncbi:DNA ligase-1 [Singulisphaera sp. GP187]|nr:DNA ligase-1 [Singulisphaera sp. GP187]